MGNGRSLHIIGAGIIGVACALRLQLHGYRVTLIDPDDPGMGCSYGNAGIMQIGACVPVATPGVLRAVPHMLLNSDQPLAIRWSYILRLMPYLTRFLAAARPGEVDRISHILASILDHAIEGFQPLLKAASAENLFTKTGELYVYETDRSFEAAKPAHELRRRRGVNIEYLDAHALRTLEPALGSIFKHAAYLTDCVSVSDPLDLTKALLTAFFSAGGVHLREKVVDFEKVDGKVHQIVTDAQVYSCDNVLLATGAWSKSLAKMLGANVPLDTERGYHVRMQNAGVDIRIPVISGDYRFGVSNLSSGLRVAGTAELASVEAPPNFARADRLIGLAQRMFPQMNVTEVDRWMGCRPSTPDSLPVISKSSKVDNAFFAFGHGHLGLTMAGITSEFVLDLIEGKASRLNISDLHCDRF